MKKHILQFATLLLLGVGMLAVSCGKDDSDDSSSQKGPNFPSKVTPTIEAGESYTLEIEPNSAWEINLPTTNETTKWFWIQDGSQKIYTKRGQAGKFTIVIQTLDETDYNNVHTCDITMMMPNSKGKQIKEVIATITIGKSERTISVYPSTIIDGDFEFNPEYADPATDLRYSYGDPATDISLIWPIGKTGYMIPILVESNFDWSVRGNIPEWISDVSMTGKAGQQIEIQLKANAEKLPLDGASAIITLGDANKTFPITVRIPACRGLFMTDFASDFKFSHKGEVFNTTSNAYLEGNAYGSVASAQNLRLIPFVVSSEGYLDYENVDWITPIDKWVGNTDVAQNRRIEIKVSANTGVARKAIILGVPASITADPWQMVGGDSGDQIAADFQQYILTTITQAEFPGTIMPSAETSVLESVEAEFLKLSTKDQWFNWLSQKFKTKNVYQLTYAKDWGHEDWNLVFPDETAQPASYKRYSEINDNFVELTSDNDWLIYSDQFKQIHMSAKTKTTGAVQFFAADGTCIGVIYCIFDPDASIGGDSMPEFYNPEWGAMDNSTLVELTSGALYNQYASYGVPVWHLTFTKPNPTMSMIKNLTQYSTSEDPSWLAVEPGTEYSTVSMTTDTTRTNAIFFYADAGKSELKFVLVCTAKR